MSTANGTPLLEVLRLRKHFPLRGGVLQRIHAWVRAVDDVSFDVYPAETLGIVGESGCGKSTLARLLLHLLVPDAGELVFDGDAVNAPDGIRVDALRRQVQMVFQDSYASLSPRMPVRDSEMAWKSSHSTRRVAAKFRCLMRCHLNSRLSHAFIAIAATCSSACWKWLDAKWKPRRKITVRSARVHRSSGCQRSSM